MTTPTAHRDQTATTPHRPRRIPMADAAPGVIYDAGVSGGAHVLGSAPSPSGNTAALIDTITLTDATPVSIVKLGD